MFEVVKRGGLARVGKWLIDEQNMEVATPNMLFMENDRFKAPHEAELLILSDKISSEKPHIISTKSLFTNQNIDENNYTVSPSLFYPPSQTELNAYANKINKENFSKGLFVVAGKGDEVVEPVAGIDAEVFVLTNAMHLASRPKSFVNTLVNLRKAIGYQKLIYAPGLGSPYHIALLAYMGIDLFDSVPLILNARLGNFLTSNGKIPKSEITESFCFCPACIDKKNDYESILSHNYYTSLSELKLIRNAISRGQFRELVESRIRTEPWMVSALRILDTSYFSFLESYLPVSGGPLIAASSESLTRPEVVRFRERVKTRYKKPSHKKVLLLLPCSAKKPYSLSKTHRIIGRIVSECGNKSAVHEVVITSPLGVVPKEVELFYPAQQYDIPVTGSWSKDEKSMVGGDITEYLKNNKYEDIVVHLPPDYDFIRDYIDSAKYTVIHAPTSKASLDNLKNVLSELVKPYEKVGAHIQQRENLRSFARFQFQDAGEALIQDSKIKGRYPNLRIFKDKKQVGMLVGDRGMISLTLDGGKIIANENIYWVKIDDFKPKGNIFAVGVLDAHKDIRIGDDVVVINENGLVGVGVAMMNPKEMIESSRGEAVRVRHLSRSEGE